MASISDVKEELDISSARWNKFIGEGVIRKEKINTYDIVDVAKQIMRYQQTMIKNNKTAKSGLIIKNNKLEKRIAELSVGGGAVTPDGLIIEKPMTKKERLDFKIQEEKLIRMKHDNEVRKKNYMPVENVFEFVTNISSEFAAFLEPLIGKIKQSIPDMNARTHNELVKMIAVGRNNLSRHIEGKTTNELIHLFNPEENQGGTESTEDT